MSSIICAVTECLTTDSIRNIIIISYELEVSTIPRRKKTETAPVAEFTAPVAAETATKAPAEKPVRKAAEKKTAGAKRLAAKTSKTAAPKETVKIQFEADEYDFAEI